MTAQPPLAAVDVRRARAEPCPFCRQHHERPCVAALAEMHAVARTFPEQRVIARLQRRRLSTRAQLLAGTIMRRPDRKPITALGLRRLTKMTKANQC